VKPAGDLADICILTQPQLTARSISDDTDAEEPFKVSEVFELIAVTQIGLKPIPFVCISAPKHGHDVVDEEEEDEPIVIP
jgi:hypothetical protein